ncbi:chemotaxis protein MotA [Sulfurivirga caldicuralii]|uniref:Chemotaxis protein MotA n=1 Tax=Sulfurivirga caldicuralii TaxID=364032 RepID=A0A1N6GKU3_9GAMM|nr:MotA/TolQ/ExbB proton channel family protein [Sulfurivirga caldicuralii]SIO08139.1 chemotaxis protein MotA [Sulfurivirga caldicuralii]
MSKTATILGALIGLIVLLLGTYDFEKGQIISAFFNIQALLLVVGGVVAAVLVNYPLDQLKCIPVGFWRIFWREVPDQAFVVAELVELAHDVKRHGLVHIERLVDTIDEPFLRFAISEALVYQDEKSLRKALGIRLKLEQLKASVCEEVFLTMASYAPAFGMMGTVMGLIMMMASQGGDQAAAAFGAAESQNMIASLMTGMGVALVTTFYGVLLSNLVFMPIAGKLKMLNEAEQLYREMVVEGVVALKRGDSPLMLKERLLAFVDDRLAQKLEEVR